MQYFVITDTHGCEKSYARFIAALKEYIKNVPKEERCLICSGDIFGANRLLSASLKGGLEGELAAFITKEFPENQRFMVIGNHDFLYGTEGLQTFIEKTGFQVLATNMTFQKGFPISTQHYIIDSVNEVAYLGITTTESKDCSHNAFETIDDFNDTKRQVKEQIEALKKQDISKYVVVSHLGLDADEELASYLKTESMQDIVILGGHSHGVTQKAIFYGEKECPIVVVNGGAYAKHLVVYNDAKQQLHCRYLKEQKTDVEAMRFIEGARQEFSIGDLSQVCFKAKGPLSGLEWYEGLHEESNIRVEDGVLTRLTTNAIQKTVESDLVLFPGAGIRSNIKEGDVTYNKLARNFLHNSEIFVFEATGKEIVEALATGILKSYRHWEGRGALLHPSKNMKYTYVIDEDHPENVIQSCSIDGEEIDLTKIYRVAGPDWLLVSHLFSKRKAKACDGTIFEMVNDYLRGKEKKVEVTKKECFGKRVASNTPFWKQEKDRQSHARKDAGVELPERVKLSYLSRMR